jgi:catechol 2,3-dioxygenase-like lactoylglutathione lyase family enzyme
MTVRGIDHFNVRASSEMLEQVRTFYCEVIGLVEGDRPPFDEFGYWLYAGERAVVHLSLASENEELAIDVPTTMNHVAFTCQGKAAFERRLTESGTLFRTAKVPATSVTQIFTRDPAGNGIELSFGEEN